MNRAEFDAIADDYAQLHARNITASGEDTSFFAHYKIVDLATEARRQRVPVRHILDFGSGIGNALPHFSIHFPQAALTCADVSTRSLAISRARHPDVVARHVEIAHDMLPLDDGSCDIAYSACVFHHIPHDEHAAWLSELWRVTRPGGMLFLYEHNPLNPLTCQAVRNCPFDENAVLVHGRRLVQRVREAGWVAPRLIYRMFFPRALAFARPIEPWLARVPLGAQYYVVARRP